MTEEQYNALRETVFLSVLLHREILSETEQMNLLKDVFGLKQQEIDQRIQEFKHYRHNKQLN